jgi:hypothetical protein
MATTKGLNFRTGEKEGSMEHVEFVDPKKADINAVEKLETGSSNLSHDEDNHHTKPPTTARDLVTEILLVEDDPTQNPWTFRMWFLGIGISVFAAYGLLTANVCGLSTNNRLEQSLPSTHSNLNPSTSISSSLL